jgi:arsenate reductase (thioredoxin)
MRLTSMRIVAIATFALTLCCFSTKCRAQTATGSQILFVCEHGNVKSLMAASYFNQLAQEIRLPLHAVARGTAPDSTTVPQAIVQGLRRDGFDVSSFHPTRVSPSDVSASIRVISIGTVLPAEAQAEAHFKIEQWNDVPPASLDYGAARDSLKSHVKTLVEQLVQRR